MPQESNVSVISAGKRGHAIHALAVDEFLIRSDRFVLALAVVDSNRHTPLAIADYCGSSRTRKSHQRNTSFL
jgi:hypothetical protein